MLKGKKSLYILLPVNLLIWGYMAYKIYSTLNESSDNFVAESPLALPKLKTNDSIAYLLRLNYEDPFLKQEPLWKGSSSPKPAAIKPVAVQKPKASPLPEKPAAEIKYLGLIENKSKGTTAAVISVNGSSQIIQPGQTYDGMVFEKVTPEFIVVKIGKEKLTIKK